MGVDNFINKLFMIILYYSPVVQWSSMRGSEPCDPGSNPGGAIVFFCENKVNEEDWGIILLHYNNIILKKS